MARKKAEEFVTDDSFSQMTQEEREAFLDEEDSYKETGEDEDEELDFDKGAYDSLDSDFLGNDYED